MLETQNHLQQVNDCPLLPSSPEYFSEMRRAREAAYLKQAEAKPPRKPPKLKAPFDQPWGGKERYQAYKLAQEGLRLASIEKPTATQWLKLLQLLHPGPGIVQDALLIHAEKHPAFERQYQERE